MSAVKGFAIVLLTAGALALTFGGFTYANESHVANAGSVTVSVEDRRSVSVPSWAGAVALIAGVALLLLPRTLRGSAKGSSARDGSG